MAVRFSDVYGAMDRDTGARNRHNAPYHAATRLCRGDPLVVSGGLEDVGWDYVDAPSAARAVVALLTAAGKPRRRVYEIALGRTVPHGELLAAALGVSAAERAWEWGFLRSLDFEPPKRRGTANSWCATGELSSNLAIRSDRHGRRCSSAASTAHEE